MSGYRPSLRVRIVFEAECSVDSAWEAMHSPAVASELYAPVLRMRAEPPFPERFASGDEARAVLRLFDLLPVGSQLIAIEDVTPARRPSGARTMRDAGRPLSGPLAMLAGWNHEITVWASPSNGAVWHDELTISGAFAPLCWPVLATMWRWRRRKLLRLARGW